jgi:Mrp family chromosome partitioning ATPase
MDRNPLRRDRVGHGEAPLVTTYARSGSSAAEAYRRVLAAVVLEETERPIRTVVVAGVRDPVGKSLVAANLAVALAQSGRNTLLVDLGAGAAVASMVGLHGSERHIRATDGQPRSVWATAQRGLSLLSAAPGGDIRGMMDSLVGLADIAVIDGPPLDVSTDTAVTASLADATILVVDAQRTHARGARAALSTLERARARLLGAVLVHFPAKTYARRSDARAANPSA